MSNATQLGNTVLGFFANDATLAALCSLKRDPIRSAHYLSSSKDFAEEESHHNDNSQDCKIV